MKMDVSHVKAIITGSSTGIGLAMARVLLEHGATVAISARPTEKLERAVDAAIQANLKVVSLPMDVRDETSIETAVSWVRKNWGSPDLLVNNAGLMAHRVHPDFFTRPEPFYKIDTDYFRDAVETNLTGYFLVSKAFVPLMIEKGQGKIVNLSTSLKTMTLKGFVPYGPSRAGSEALSHIMSADLKEFGIMVNVLLPGGAVDKGIYGDGSDDFSNTPIKPLSIDIMKDPILFLASSLSDTMTGERIIATEFDSFLKKKRISFPR